jgi:homoserine dehydrogenase
MKTSSIGIGLFGLGTIGGGVAEMLLREKQRLQSVLGANLELIKAVDINPALADAISLPSDKFSTKANDILDNPDIDLVVELIGGTTVAKDIVLAAINAGKPVVTANKALLARHGKEVFALAAKNKIKIAFEASVGGGIPLIRSLRDGLAANQINECLGIVNGTCNYILSRMTSEGADFQTVLKDAQKLGYAEADPTFDIEGMDAAHKLAILAALSTGRLPRLEDISVQGISSITALDISFAQEIGFVIKLLAVYRRHGSQAELRVHPALIDHGHLLASVNGPFNAIFINGSWVGDILLYGAGAGRRATASAVVADIIDLAREKLNGNKQEPANLGNIAFDPAPLQLTPMAQVMGKHYFRFTARDRPGVLATIAAILGQQNISIEAVLQKGRQDAGGSVPIIILTHEANEQAVQTALKEIDQLPVITQPTMVIKVI